MMDWIFTNLGNIAVVLLLAAAVFWSVRTIISDRKKGKCSCGSQCGCCPMGGSCHVKKKHRAA